MLTKNKVLNTFTCFSEKFTIDELIDKLILLEKIEKGIEQSENREVISDDELNKEMDKWFE